MGEARRRPAEDRPACELDDERDRDELRTRYYGLLQELRVLLPGTQILVAFLLAVPFNNRFADVDHVGELAYAVALLTGGAAIVLLVAPTVFHRVGARRSRAQRLIWGIRVTRLGLVCMAVSLAAALLFVCRFVYGAAVGWGAGAAALVVLASVWVALPLGSVRTHDDID